jgi:hypothetical protein
MTKRYHGARLKIVLRRLVGSSPPDTFGSRRGTGPRPSPGHRRDGAFSPDHWWYISCSSTALTSKRDPFTEAYLGNLFLGQAAPKSRDASPLCAVSRNACDVKVQVKR